MLEEKEEVLEILNKCLGQTHEELKQERVLQVGLGGGGHGEEQKWGQNHRFKKREIESPRRFLEYIQAFLN
jgi:hypothetical protein